MQIYSNLSLKSLPGEKWKRIPGFPDYSSSNLGRVKSYKRKTIILSQALNDRGYLKIVLANRKNRKCVSAHQAVALAWCDNPNNYTEVNHVNSIKTDNNADNLRWCTRSENMKHMIAQTGPGHRSGMSNPKATLVMHVEYGIFCTLRDAAAMSGFKEANFNNMIYETGYRKNRTKFILV